MVQRLAQILTYLDLHETYEQWLDGWAGSEATYVETELFQLEPAFVETQCRQLRMEAEVSQALQQGLALFKRQPALKRLFWHCHFTLLQQGPIRPGRWQNWPMLPAELDEAGPLFYTYLCLSAIPQTLAYHRQRRIPSEISLDTLSDLELWLKDYYQQQGRWGFAELGWLTHHLAGRLYKLGRLQFELTHYPYDYHVFHNWEDGQVIVLAGEGMPFRRDGLSDGASGIRDPEAWTASLQPAGAAVLGNPVQPQGYAENRLVELNFSKWGEVLKKGDPTLGVHIPAAGPMDFDRCGASFTQAISFFKEHFPGHDSRAFICSSWLLDPQLEQYLSSESNIVRFLREWYLTPQPGQPGAQILWRIFRPSSSFDLNTLPQQTSLQRAIVHHIKNGGQWHDGAGFILPQRLDWGGQFYRQMKFK